MHIASWVCQCLKRGYLPLNFMVTQHFPWHSHDSTWGACTPCPDKYGIGGNHLQVGNHGCHKPWLGHPLENLEMVCWVYHIIDQCLWAWYPPLLSYRSQCTISLSHGFPWMLNRSAQSLQRPALQWFKERQQRGKAGDRDDCPRYFNSAWGLSHWIMNKRHEERIAWGPLGQNRAGVFVIILVVQLGNYRSANRQVGNEHIYESTNKTAPSSIIVRFDPNLLLPGVVGLSLNLHFELDYSTFLLRSISRGLWVLQKYQSSIFMNW